MNQFLASHGLVNQRLQTVGGVLPPLVIIGLMCNDLVKFLDGTLPFFGSNSPLSHRVGGQEEGKRENDDFYVFSDKWWPWHY